MKRVLQIATLFALALVLGLAFIGCGNSHAGKYKFESMSLMGQTFTAEDLDSLSALAGETISADDIYLELKSDGSFTLAAMSQVQEGTYEVSGSTITLTVQGSPVTGTIENGTVTIDESGTGMTFKK